MVSLEELQAAVLGIPGVVGAEVAESQSGSPSVRVWTDDSRDPNELRSEVRSLVARAHMPSPEPESTPPEEVIVRPISSAPGLPGNRRGGLGRGLDSIIAVADSERAPAHLVSIDLAASPVLELIAVEESATGVTVRAVDSAKSEAEAKVIGGPGSINPAIVAAVSELQGEMPAPRLVSVELRDTEVAAVLVVTLELADTTVAAGAAVVQGGMPFTLGRATWSAISSARA
ncbi:hypothetical protein ACFLRH_03020 [Actinomycetota bacterium]